MNPFQILSTFLVFTVLDLGHGQGGFSLVYGGLIKIINKDISDNLSRVGWDDTK